MAQLVFGRIVSTINTIEVYTYEKPIWIGFNGSGGRCEDAEGLHAGKSRSKTRRQVVRQINANFTPGDKFVTLTYKVNMTDVDQGNSDFKRFIQRMRWRYGLFKYLAVIEFQERGAVHYHMISDLPYIKKADLAEIWSHGYVKINQIKHVDNVGLYVSAYMTEELTDPRLHGRKAYLGSRNLEKPTIMYGDAVENVKKAYQLGELVKPSQVDRYSGEYTGEVLRVEYNLLRPSGKRGQVLAAN